MENDQLFSTFLINNKVHIDSIGKALKACPKGTLCVREKNGKTYFIQLASKNGKQFQRGISKQPEIIEGLIKRELLEAELDVRKKQQELVMSLEKKWPEFDMQLQVQQLKKRCRTINDETIRNALMTPETAWASEEYEQSDYKPENKRQINSRGLKLRSKSEVLITEKFYEYNVAFRYEQVIEINGIKLNPDFTIKRSDGKIIYWEHEGLTNSQSYLSWQERKHQLYASAGIFPWDNLIVTYDKTDGIIDLRVVESEIKNRLLL